MSKIIKPLIINILLLLISGFTLSVWYIMNHPSAPIINLLSDTDASTIVDISSDKFTKIYYTTDGSIPTEQSTLYTSTLTITDRSNEENLIGQKYPNVKQNWNTNHHSDNKVQKGTSIRAIAISPWGKSQVTTKTVFPGITTSENILSIVADPEDLFGPGGIYSTGWKYDEWYLNGQDGTRPTLNYNCDLSIPSNIELTIKDNESLNQMALLRIQGNSSRENTYKRFAISSSSKLSESDFFSSNIFEGTDTHSIMLKQAVPDSLAFDILNGRNLSCQRSIPIETYLNGDFLYSTFILERFDEEYFMQHYNIKEPLIIKDGKSKTGDDTQIIYDEFMTWVSQNDFSNSEEWEQLKNQIDIQSYADFIISSTYLCNVDMSEGKNYILWRSKNANGNGYNDGKWRWCIFDIDFLVRDDLTNFYNVSNLAEINSVTGDYPYTDSLFENTLFSACMENPEFHSILKETLEDMINTTFSSEHILTVLDSHNLPYDWNNSFFEKRPEYIKKYWTEVL